MFFEPIPAREEPPFPPRRREPQDGPPHGVVPGVIALELVLARTDRVLVALSRVDVYPTGFALELIIAARDEEVELDTLLGRGPFMHRRGRRRREAGPAPDDLLRFGLQLSDGRKTTVDPERGPPRGGGEAFGLSNRSGSGGETEWTEQLWGWPLPPPGPLTLALEWRAAGVGLTTHVIEAQSILDAASRAQVVFEGGEGQAGAGRFTIHSFKAPSPNDDPPSQDE